MTTASLTRAEMLQHLVAVLQPDMERTPELPVVQAALAALPDVEYVMYDPEAGDLIPAPLYALGGTVTAQFAPLEGSMGYGEVTVLATVQGPALSVSLGGSSGQSASVLWVVPTTLIGYLDMEPS